MASPRHGKQQQPPAVRKSFSSKVLNMKFMQKAGNGGSSGSSPGGVEAAEEAPIPVADASDGPWQLSLVHKTTAARPTYTIGASYVGFAGTADVPGRRSFCNFNSKPPPEPILSGSDSEGDGKRKESQDDDMGRKLRKITSISGGGRGGSGGRVTKGPIGKKESQKERKK